MSNNIRWVDARKIYNLSYVGGFRHCWNPEVSQSLLPLSNREVGQKLGELLDVN